MPEQTAFPYEELRDDIAGGNGDYFDDAKAILDLGYSSNQIWMVTNLDDDEPEITRNEDGTFQGRQWFTYSVAAGYYDPSRTGGLVVSHEGLLGYVATKEVWSKEDEEYQERDYIERTEEELVELSFDGDRSAMLEAFERQQAGPNDGMKP